jgi:hypothetical protein
MKLNRTKHSIDVSGDRPWWKVGLLYDKCSWTLGIEAHFAPHAFDPLGQRHYFVLHFGPVKLAAGWLA